MGRRLRWDTGSALILALVLPFGPGRPACAQTEDYFATPWIVAPLPAESAGAAPSSASPSNAAPRAGGTSNLYGQALANAAPGAPPFLYSLNFGIDEIATDNVAETETNRMADLSSLFSAGATLSANSARLTGVVSASGLYRRNINDTSLDQFSEYGYANAQSAVIPGNLYLSANGSIDDLPRQGGGSQNSIVQATQDTHSYEISGSPYLYTSLGDIGLNVLRYQIGQAWFSNNTASLPSSGLGPITASTDQTAREDLKFAGTIFARLMSDVSLSGSEDDTGNTASGSLQKANGELVNEYELTRSVALIGGGGYEYLHDPDVLSVNSRGPIWDVGGRLRPNADSSFLLVYGHHDGKSDFAGELAWRLTPFTNIYAAYTDSLANAQESLITNSADSVLGPDGAVTGVTFQESTVVGVLDDPALSAAPGSESNLAPAGIPLGTSSSYSPLQDGLFRTKLLSASGRSILEGDPIVLTAYDVQNISYTPYLAPSSSAEGANLSWSPGLSQNLTGLTVVGFAHQNGAERGNIYNAAVGATYELSHSLSVILRYDFIRRDTEPATGGYLQNAVTVSLHKSLD